MNKPSPGFSAGISTWFQSFGFIARNGLVHYFIYPVLIALFMTFLFSKVIEMGVDTVSLYVHALFGEIPLEQDGDWWTTLTSWLATASEWITRIALNIAFFYVYWKLNKYIVLILMSPIMALLSERCEEIITGETYPFEWAQFARDVWRGILIALRNMFLEIGWIAGVWLLGLLITTIIPPLALVITPLSAILLFAVGAYFYGYSTLDYNSERKRLKIGESSDFVRCYKWMAIANGSIFSVLLWIPLLGMIVAPITCTVAATLAYQETGELGKSRFSLPRTP